MRQIRVHSQETQVSNIFCQMLHYFAEIGRQRVRKVTLQQLYKNIWPISSVRTVSLHEMSHVVSVATGGASPLLGKGARAAPPACAPLRGSAAAGRVVMVRSWAPGWVSAHMAADPDWESLLYMWSRDKLLSPLYLSLSLPNWPPWGIPTH